MQPFRPIPTLYPNPSSPWIYVLNLDLEKAKEDKVLKSSPNDLPSAYLGPQIWNDMLLSDDLKLEPVDLEDLLDGSNGDEEVRTYVYII